jgi:hypothetical protein
MNFAKNHPGGPVVGCFDYIIMLPLIILKLNIKQEIEKREERAVPLRVGE